MCPTRNGHYQVSTLETTHLTLTPSVFHRKPRYTPLNFSSMVPPHDAQIIQKRQQYMSCHIWTSFLWVKPLLLPCHVHGISLRYPCCIWDHNFVLLLKTFNPTQQIPPPWSCGCFRFQLPMMPTQLNQRQKHLHCGRYCSVWAMPISYVVLWPPSTYTPKRIHLYENIPVPY